MASALRKLLANAEPFDRVAVTMTGELADCFASRAGGVKAICDAVLQVAADKQPVFYQTNGQFVDYEQATANWQQTAAANWHALAAFVGQSVPDCLMVDIGSTTTDIIPIQNGSPATIGTTDLTRLQNSELVYTGVTRTPICAICKSVQLDGKTTPLAAELFSTMLDVYLILGLGNFPSQDTHTADGRSADLDSAERRIAKMVCVDRDELDSATFKDIAIQIASVQQNLIEQAIRTVQSRFSSIPQIVFAGEGDWLGSLVLNNIEADYDVNLVTYYVDDSICQQLISQAGPAFAVAQLAQSLIAK